jgi:uncharacterized membrane protein YfcA
VAAPLAYVVPFILLGALLYTSVGHGGATAYLAVLTLAGYAVGDIVTTVLVLNILAAGIAFVHFQQGGHLRARLLLPFVVTSIPAAFLGGRVPLSGRVQAVILGVALLAAAARFLFFSRMRAPGVKREGPLVLLAAMALGAVLGFLAGATGIGGGIFLSPLLLLLGWATIKEAASVASAFIVLNSLAGLAAKLGSTPIDLALLVPLAVTVVAGALLGAWAGARRLRTRPMQVLLGIVLLVAGAKALVG